MTDKIEKKKKKFKPAYKMTKKEKSKHYDKLSKVKIEDLE